MTWDADRYRNQFGFVAAYGLSLLDDLDPLPGERVLDLGCGTGELAAEIAGRGASVVAVDADEAMVAAARSTAPTARVLHGDAQHLPVDGPFDAVFSNAVLHWVPDPMAARHEVRRVLRAGGRFVAEQGGAGNVRTVLAALDAACARHGLAAPARGWDFPTPAQEAARLESAGFVVRRLALFDRPTALPPGADGASGWLRMFGPHLLAQLPPEAVQPVLADVDAIAAPALLGEDGVWRIDYVRLRWVAQAEGVMNRHGLDAASF
jgi:SAM-dependent methyltransferase